MLPLQDLLGEPVAAYHIELKNLHQLLMDDLEFSKKVAAQIYLCSIYQVSSAEMLRRLLRDSGHRLLRLPPPQRPTRGTQLLERTESRDAVPVVLLVPEYMQPQVSIFIHISKTVLRIY
jgi:hypothetical protein